MDNIILHIRSHDFADSWVGVFLAVGVFGFFMAGAWHATARLSGATIRAIEEEVRSREAPSTGSEAPDTQALPEA
jgi:hypothetical protein